MEPKVVSRTAPQWISDVVSEIKSHGYDSAIFALPINRDEDTEACVVPAGLQPPDVIELLFSMLFYAAKKMGIPMEEAIRTVESDIAEIAEAAYKGEDVFDDEASEILH